MRRGRRRGDDRKRRRLTSAANARSARRAVCLRWVIRSARPAQVRSSRSRASFAAKRVCASSPTQKSASRTWSASVRCASYIFCRRTLERCCRAVLPEKIAQRLRLPLIAAPMLAVSGPELVIAACKAGVIGAFPLANARSPDGVEAGCRRSKLLLLRAADESPDRPPAPFCPNLIIKRAEMRAELAACAASGRARDHQRRLADRSDRSTTRHADVWSSRTSQRFITPNVRSPRAWTDWSF